MKLGTLIINSKKELKNIKKYATKEEIKDLISGVESGYIDGNNKHACVYGLMTNSCFSDRATQLIEQCASTYKIPQKEFDKNSIKSIKGILHKKRRNASYYYSQLELLLIQNKMIAIDLIKEIFKV